MLGKPRYSEARRNQNLVSGFIMRDLRPTNQRGAAGIREIVKTTLDPCEPAIDIVLQNLRRDRRQGFQIARPFGAVRKRGGAGEGALPVGGHDRSARSAAGDRIAAAALVLVDKARSPSRILARRHGDRTEKQFDPITGGYANQAEAEPTAKVAEPGIAFAPLASRRHARRQPHFIASSRTVDALQNQFEIELQLQLADDDDLRLPFAQRDDIAAADFPLHDEVEIFEETLHRRIE